MKHIKHIFIAISLLLPSIAIANPVVVPTAPATSAQGMPAQGSIQGAVQGTLVAPVNNSSFAVTLARQAGAIAGAAQACGQDTSLLAARLDEAITTVAQNPVDGSDAIAAYQQSAKDAHAKQSAEKILPCDMVLRDYQQLPLLRDDYREVVLSKLKDQTSTTTPTKIPTTTTATTPTQQTSQK